MSAEAAFLSIQDIRDRWSCGRTFVYEAIAQMETGSYLERLWVGNRQRIALRSVERWEAEHARKEKDAVRSTVVKLREANETRARPAPGKPVSAKDLMERFRRAL